MKLDPVSIEVIRNALIYTAMEMGISLRNSAYSHNIKERMDHSCAIFDPNGNLLAQAEHIPVHLGSLPWGIKNVIGYLKDNCLNLKRHDIIMVNDPYIVGTHLNDVTLIKPIFFGKILIGFSVNKAHHVDVGGQIPGSISCDAASLSQEGVVIPPVKLMEQGQINQGALKSFIGNVRSPDITQGDLRAQIAAANMGYLRILELADKYGIEILFTAFQEIISYGEMRMRDKLNVIPEGIYRAEDCLEDIGEANALTWIRVKISRDEKGLKVCFSGTDSQVNAPFNAVFGVTLSAVYFAVKSIIDPDGPMNEGFLKPVTVLAPEASLVNPISPAPVSGGNLETAQRVADVVFKALAQALPDRTPAASCGSMNNVIISGYDHERNRQWVYYETIGGGSGGRPGMDGIDGVQCNMTNTMNTPVEAIEQCYPLLFEQYEIRSGTSGAGRWRGGNGIKRAWTLLGPWARVTVLGDRNKIPPWGMNGGKPGGMGEYSIIRNDGSKERLKSKSTKMLKKGDTLIIETPGGGGYGEGGHAAD